jgi:flagellar hook-length control protein FliK
MNGVAQLPELPTDSTASSTSTVSDTTAIHNDGGAFDQLVAKVAPSPKHDPSTSSNHEEPPTTGDTAAVADSVTQAIMVLVPNDNSANRSNAHAKGNDRPGPQPDGGKTDVLSGTTGNNLVAVIAADSLPEQHQAGTRVDTKLSIDNKNSAKDNAANVHSPTSSGESSTTAVLDHTTQVAASHQPGEISKTNNPAEPVHALRTGEIGTGEIGSHRSTSANEAGQQGNDLSQSGHENRVGATSLDAAAAVSNAHNVSSGTPVQSPLAGVRQSTGHSGELPGVTSQLLSVIAPLRQTPAGGQTLTIALHPAGLGEVRVSMTVTDGQTTVRLIASTPEGANAIRGSLGSLESGLSDGRQQAHVFLGNELSGSGQQNSNADQAGDDPRRSSAAESPMTSQSHPELDRSVSTDGLTTQSITRLINMRI